MRDANTNTHGMHIYVNARMCFTTIKMDKNHDGYRRSNEWYSPSTIEHNTNKHYSLHSKL
jgi:hypothetical protein